jgi:RNA polymerase sigma-70 factor, ECF subfamily
VTDWKMIVAQHSPLVWSTASRLLGNHADAQDCFQETFYEAIRLDRRETVRDWGPLLRHLATVRALDLLRVRCRMQNRTDPVADPAAAVGREADPSEEAEAAELAERLRAALAQLPPEQASVFCLSCLGKLNYREIGERLGLTTSAVGVLLHRARGRLRELLTPVDAGAEKSEIPQDGFNRSGNVGRIS